MAGVELEKVVNFDSRDSALVLLWEEISTHLPYIRFLVFDKRSSTCSMRRVYKYIPGNNVECSHCPDAGSPTTIR
jgi:hypothetical protein